jgi:hypothetical protein
MHLTTRKQHHYIVYVDRYISPSQLRSSTYPRIMTSSTSDMLNLVLGKGHEDAQIGKTIKHSNDVLQSEQRWQITKG